MDAQTIELGFQQVWEMFQETDRRFKETDKKFQETAQQIKETGERFKETDKQFKETGERFKETDERFKETDKQFKETDKKFDKYFHKVKELDRNWGKLVEALVRPSVAAQFRKRGIPVIGSGQQVERILGADTIEIDILLSDGDSLIAVEVKTTLRIENVDEHVQNHLRPFKRFFPEYQDKKIYGAVAYIHVEENADRYAYKKGLFVLTFTTGDLVTILNDDNFRPQNFG